MMVGARPRRGRKGLDFSRWQRVRKAGTPDGYDYTVDWAAVKLAGYEIIYFKLTEGDDYLDPKAVERIREAAQFGFLIGVYHFLRNDVDPLRQAAWFYQQVIENDLLDLIALKPAVDIEDDKHGYPDDLDHRVDLMLREVTRLFQINPVIYTRATYWNQYVLRGKGPQARFQIYVWWVAHWNTSIEAPWLPKEAINYSLWQDRVDLVPGVPGYVDVNWARPGMPLEELVWKRLTLAEPRPLADIYLQVIRLRDQADAKAFQDHLVALVEDFQKHGTVRPYVPL